MNIHPEYVLGLDLSSGWAQSACAAISVSPDDRGVHDVDMLRGLAVHTIVEGPGRNRIAWQGLREAMHEQGDLVLHEGRTVDVQQLIVEAFDRWGRPETIVGDRYRHNELKDALEPLGYFEGHNLKLRGHGIPGRRRRCTGLPAYGCWPKRLALRKSLLLKPGRFRPVVLFRIRRATSR